MLLSTLFLLSKLLLGTEEVAVGRSDVLLDAGRTSTTYIDALANARDKVVSAASKLDGEVEGARAMAGKHELAAEATLSATAVGHAGGPDHGVGTPVGCHCTSTARALSTATA